MSAAHSTYRRLNVPWISMPLPRLAGSHTCLGTLYCGVAVEGMPKMSPRRPDEPQKITYTNFELTYVPIWDVMEAK